MPSITFSSPKVYREGIRFRSSNNGNNIDGNEKENNLETTQRSFHPIRFLKSTLRSRHKKGEDRNDVEDIGVEHTLQSHDHERVEQAEVKSETREECEEAKEEIRAAEDVKIDAIEHSERVNKQDDDPPEQKTRVDGNNESEGAEDEPRIDSETKQPNEDTNAFTATPLQTRQFKNLGPGVHVLSPRDAAKFYEQNFGSPIQSGDMLNGGINVSPCVNFPSTNYFAVGSPPIYYYYGGCTFETSQATQFAQNTNFNQSQFSERNVPEVQYPPGYDPEIRFDSGEYFESHSEQSYRSEPEVKFPHGYDPEIHFDSEHDKKSFDGVQTWSENFSMNHFPGASRQPQHFYEMIPLGTAVFLRGLISAGNHNGDRGVIMQYSSATQRYLVELGETGETVSVKPENILQQIHVKIHGIISQPDLNGCIGLIWYTENKYRYSIYIASLEKFASIKPENVMLEKGTVARVWRLEHRQELNGKWGTIKNWIEESNKYDIQFSENQMIRVKAEHVML